MDLFRRFEARIAFLIYAFINTLLNITRVVMWPRKRPGNAKRICIYRIGNIGDIICAVPAMRAIRRAYPEAHLTLLTSPGKRGMPGAVELLSPADWLDEIIVYHADEINTPAKVLRLAGNLRKRRFDLWFELPADLATLKTSIRNMFFAYAAGARWAAGWQIKTIRWAAQAQSDYLHFENEVDRLLSLVKRYRIPTGQVAFGLPVREVHSLAASGLLRSLGVPKSARLAALAPGAKRSTNRWPPERFVKLGRRFTKRGYRVLVLGAGSEWGLCQTICEGIGSGAHNLAGKTSLLEAAALLAKCALLVGNDSGLQHLASAVNVPCISLFSCWQLRGKWRPYGKGSVILQKRIPCHTCFLEECPYENKCMKAISVEEVCNAVASRLGWEKPPG